MTLDELVAYCLGKPGAEETHPFGENPLVTKVGGKSFAFIGLGEQVVGVKCGNDSAEAAEWRARYPDAITEMSYLARYGWNTVAVEQLPDDEMRELVDGSYDDVVARLPKSRRP